MSNTTINKLYSIDSLPEYTHISGNNDINFEQTGQTKGVFKPSGLYYAKGTEWLIFLRDEMGYDDLIEINDNVILTSTDLYIFEIKILQKEKINIMDDPNPQKILLIDNFADLTEFTDRYNYSKTIGNVDNLVNWKKVSKNYGGIEFANYHQIMKEMQGMDFYDAHLSRYAVFGTFDVNGGVIWNVYPDIKKIYSLV